MNTGRNKRDTVMQFEYESCLSLKQARFYYSNDTITINAERIWHSNPAKILEDKIIGPYPDEDFIMGFLYVADNVDLSVSSELLSN